MTTADLLRSAAKLIQTRGWGRRYYRNADGCHCAIGALRAVCGIEDKADTNDGEYPSPEVLRALLFLRRAAGAVDTGRWNDAPDRTVDDVLAAFDRAAILAEAEVTP